MLSNPTRIKPDEHPKNPLLAQRMNLGDAMRYGVDPPEELEPGILLEGKIHHIFAPSESGKTMIALWLIAQRIAAGEYVIFFDSENGAHTISERLRRMGVGAEAVAEYLIYLPFVTLNMSRETRRAFGDLLDIVRPSLIVFDAWASFLSSAELSENENSDIEGWDTAFTKQAKSRGIASLILDHVPHDGVRSRGAGRKKEVADIQWRVKRTQAFNRDQLGEVVLLKEKDREGWLPGSLTFSVGGRDGEIVCEPSAGTIETPSSEDGLTPSARTALDILRREFGAEGARTHQWLKALGGTISEASFYRARKLLLLLSLISESNRRYYPAPEREPEPEPGDGESKEFPIDTGNSHYSHLLSSNSHESSESDAASTLTHSLPPIGESDESKRESKPVAQEGGGMVADGKRHGVSKPDPAPREAGEGRDGQLEMFPSSLAEVENGDAPYPENGVCHRELMPDDIIESPEQAVALARRSPHLRAGERW